MRALFLLAFALLFGCTSGSKGDSPKEPQAPAYPWEECSNEIGKHACNFFATSPEGMQELYQYYQRPIILDLSTMWCGYCQQAGREADEVQQLFADDQLVHVTVLLENFAGETPTDEDINSWRDNLGVTESPVWSSSRDLISADPTVGWSSTGWPTFYFIDKNMVVRGVQRGYSKQALIDAAESMINNDTGARWR